jgi:arsenate reductase
MNTLLPPLENFRKQLDFSLLSEERKIILNELIQYVQQQRNEKKEIHLNFICTHNSRRSQFSQVWAKTAAYYYGIDMHSYSGGVEVTEFNQRAVDSLVRTGFRIAKKEEENPKYLVYFSNDAPPLFCFSKLYDNELNAKNNFAAVMTCSHADENCPFIPGADKRIAVRYNDPKEFDGTAIEKEKYDERSKEIATEMFYIFSNIK